MDNISPVHKATDDKVEEKPKVEANGPSVVEERPKSAVKTQIIIAPMPDKVTEQIPEQERKGTEERKDKENGEDKGHQETVKAAAESVSVHQKGSPTISDSEEKKEIKQQQDLSAAKVLRKDDPTSDIDKEQQETTDEGNTCLCICNQLSTECSDS